VTNLRVCHYGKYACSKATNENDIPHCTKLHDKIMQKTEEVMDLINVEIGAQQSQSKSLNFSKKFNVLM
jgi:hypothetical protein